MFYILNLLVSLMGFCGAFLLFHRLIWQRYVLLKHTADNSTYDDRVSVVIPCRNEEKNLPSLLETIKNQSYDNLETIVVDDNSSDATGEVARKFDTCLLTLSSKEKGWKGKPWACWNGYKLCLGDYILFTDADTTIDETAIARSIAYMKNLDLDLMSAVPYHDNKRVWEKLLGVFQLFILVVTKPYTRKIDPKQLYGIGQYLLFKREAYDRIGGHSAVKKLLVDDITLINVLVAKGMNYGVYPASSLYKVRMYSSFKDFVQGWKRHIRGGVRTLSLMPLIEMFAYYSIFVHSTSFTNPYIDAVTLGVSIPTILKSQREIGNFSAWGVLLVPFSFLLFTWVNIIALYDTLLQKDYVWKGRSYSPDTLS